MSRHHQTFRYHADVHVAGDRLVSDSRTFLLGKPYKVDGHMMPHVAIPGYGNVFVAVYGADGEKTFQLMPSTPGFFVSQDHGNSWHADISKSHLMRMVDIHPTHPQRAQVESHLGAAGIAF